MRRCQVRPTPCKRGVRHGKEDLLSFGTGLDVVDRARAPEEVGTATEGFAAPVPAMVRDGQMLRYADPGARTLRRGDRVVCVRA